MSISTKRSWQGSDLFAPLRIRTPTETVVRPRRCYIPSWTKKSEMKRDQIMSKNNDLFSPRPSDIVAGLTPRVSQSPVSVRSTTRHEHLEQQYQDLRKMMVERNEDNKQGLDSHRLSDSTKTWPRSSRTHKTSGKSSISASSEYFKESVSVKDFLQSNEFGSDHFSKHLSCVKKLAKRYRRHRRPPKFKTVIEIIE